MTDVRQLLERACDDTGRPLRTDAADLLSRAKSARARHRRRTTAVAVASTALALAVPTVATQVLAGPGGGTPAGPAATSRPASGTSSTATSSAAMAGPLTEETIVARCRSQLHAYNSLVRWRGGAALPATPDLPLDSLFVVNADRGYRVGDVVAIDSRTKYQGLARLCRIPAAGHEADAVPLDSLLPDASDRELIGQMCSQADPVSGPPADVRGSRVVVAAGTPDYVLAVVDLDGARFSCMVPRLELSDRLVFVQRPLPPEGRSTVVVESAVANPKSQAARTVYYWAAGEAPPSATEIEVRIGGRPASSHAVEDAAYAFVIEVAASGVQDVTYTVRDGSGRVLARG